MIKKSHFVILFILLSSVFTAIGQNLKISGVVNDDLGVGLPGASVTLKGTDRGVITDIDGKFTIEISINSILQVSYMGYMSVNEKVNGNTKFMKITLQENAAMLSEVVAIGYGGVKKSDLTGVVQSIKADGLTMSSASNVGQMLQGRVSGLYINSANNDPGSVPTMTLRGQGSFASNGDPLIIVDGFPMEGLASLNRINPNDILQMDVLKDASAAAIYGARGANRVIIVTTKTGREGKLKIEYSGKIYTQAAAKQAQVMNAEEYLRFYNDLAKDPTYALSLPAGFNGEHYPFPIEYYLNGLLPDTKWKDEALNTNLNQEHNISISGGSKDFKYRASGNFLDGNALVGPAKYTRYNFATKLVYEKDHLYISADMNFTQEQRNNVKTDYYAALRFPPVVSVLDSTGILSKHPVASMSWSQNPFYHKLLTKDNSEDNTIRIYVTAKYNILKGLYIEGRLGYDRAFSEGYYDSQPYVVNDKNRASINYSNRSNLMNDWVINYATTLNNHTISAMVGTSYQKFVDRGDYMMSTQFPTPTISYYSMQTSIGIDRSISSYWTERSTQAFFGRINYDYKSKYLATLNFRADAATQFGSENKWGTFPSLALAWKVDKESFFDVSNPYIQTLKLRAGYGISGNSSVPTGRTQSLLQFWTTTMGDGVTNGISWPGGYVANPSLHWEKATTTNLGIEFGNSFYYFDLSYYIKNSSDLIMDRQVAHETGYSNVSVNKGLMVNRGLEAKLDFYFDFFDRKLQWKPSVWMSVNNNKVTGMDGDKVQWNGLWFGTSYGSVGLRQENSPFNSMYAYVFDGIWSTSETLQASVYGAKPGDPKFKDLNHFDKNGNVVPGRDGKIDDADLVYAGDASPKYLGGFSNSIRYKGIELNFLIEAVLDKKVENFNRAIMTFPQFEWYGNLSREALDRWTPDHQNTDIPILTRTVAPQLLRSTWCVQDASFVRMRELSLSYQFPLKDTFIEDLKLFTSVSNLFTITKYKGVNPDVFAIDSQYNLNPFARTITIGINIML